jgi:Putative cyclase
MRRKPSIQGVKQAVTITYPPAAAIHEFPLNLCFGPGVVFDMRHKADGEEITVADLRASLRSSGAYRTPNVHLIAVMSPTIYDILIWIGLCQGQTVSIS